MQWEKALEDYGYYLRLEQGLSENTIEGYRFDVRRLMRYCKTLDHNNKPQNVDVETLKDFVYQISKEVQPPTQSRILSGIKGFFRYMELEGYRKDNPTLLIETPKTRKTFPDTLAVNEVDELIQSIDMDSKHGMRNKCILELLYSCGLRVSELTELKCADLFFDKSLIRVKGKGDKVRWAPIADMTIKIIREYKNLKRHNHAAKGFEDVLFLNNRGKSITRVMVYTIVKKAAVLANINKNISPHTLRHSYATHLVENGADIQLVQHMMGHASITTTERYIHMSQSHLKDVITKFHPRSS